PPGRATFPPGEGYRPAGRKQDGLPRRSAPRNDTISLQCYFLENRPQFLGIVGFFLLFSR
ncbi:MAG: hypothetical protein RSD46_06885, partial [Oscillospiraceae bacterium]